MKPQEVDPKPCDPTLDTHRGGDEDPTLDTHRGGDEGQARRPLTESRVKQEEQVRLRNRDSAWGGCVFLCPRGSLETAESSQGELDRWAKGGGPLSQERGQQEHGLAPSGCLWTTTQEMQLDSRVGKIPWSRKWKPIPVFLPGEPHGQRSLVGYSPWTCKRVGYD